MRLKVGVLVTIAAVSGLSGCGDGPKLVPVSGTVTLNGQPLKDAVISFLPEDFSKGALPGEDITGPAGNYKAMTRGRSGLVPGKYKVIVTKTTIDASKVPASFKDDPYMAKLAVEGPESGQGQAKSALDLGHRGVPAQVEPAGGILDFDVKAEFAK